MHSGEGGRRSQSSERRGLQAGRGGDTAEFEKQTGDKLVLDSDIVGALAKRIEGSETFDVVFVSRGAVDDLTKKGKVVSGSRVNLVRVGIGVMVREGAPTPDVSSVEAFKRAVLGAKSVAFIDPASGGSSGSISPSCLIALESVIKSRRKPN